MTGRPHPADEPACPLPSSLEYLWIYFCDIAAGRPAGQMGILPIPAVEFRAWEELNEIKLERWELGALRQLDALFLRIMAAKD